MSITVLMVDDEDNARQNIGEFLTSKGYEAVGVAPWVRLVKRSIREKLM
jgi:DNA-binding NtrC family response regulator